MKKVKLTKHDITSLVSDISNADYATVKKVILAYQEVILLSLMRGADVYFGELGKFVIKKRKNREARMQYNPHYREETLIPAKEAFNYISFHVYKPIREQLEEETLGNPYEK